MKVHTRGLLLPVLGFLLVGCAGPSVEGTWKVTPGEELPIPATVTTTFAKPDKSTTVVNAELNAPGISGMKLQADVFGTYKLDGEKLSVTTGDVKIKSTDGKELNSFIADQAKSAVKDNIGKNLTGTLKWQGNDRFTVTLADGASATFDRVKG